MSKLFHRTVLGMVGLLWQSGMAAPQRVEAFDTQTWQGLRVELTKPAVVVFSTTDCTHCPRVIDQLAQEIEKRQLKTPLIVVAMDVAPGEADSNLMKYPPYQRVDRLFAFAGQAQAVRYSVNPAWRGVIPYVGFLHPTQAPVWVSGPPSLEQIAKWAMAGISETSK